MRQNVIVKQDSSSKNEDIFHVPKNQNLKKFLTVNKRGRAVKIIIIKNSIEASRHSVRYADERKLHVRCTKRIEKSQWMEFRWGFDASFYSTNN